MPYTDLLRVTVFLTAAEATALGAITAIAADRDDDTDDGPRRRRLVAGRARRRPLPGPARRAPPTASATPSPGARTATSPARRDARPGSPLGRLWPIGVIALVAGGLGLFFPGVAAIGAGYALLVALAWRTREAAVLGDRAARRRQVLRRAQLGPAPDRAGPHARACAATACRPPRSRG